MKILGRARKSPRISENFGNTSNPFLRKLKRLMKHMENFGNSSKVFSRCFYDFLKFSENLWKSSEVFISNFGPLLYLVQQKQRTGYWLLFRCWYPTRANRSFSLWVFAPKSTRSTVVRIRDNFLNDNCHYPTPCSFKSREDYGWQFALSQPLLLELAILSVSEGSD